MSSTRHPAHGTAVADWRAFGLWVAGTLTVRGAAAWLLAGVLSGLVGGEIALDGRIVDAPAAAALVAGEGYAIDGTPIASHVPGYPLVLALALAVTPSLDVAVLTVQVGGGALVVGLIFWLGTLLFGVQVGHVAAALALVFPDLVAYSLLNLSETPQLLCILVAAAYTVRVLRRAPAWSAATLGLALGLGTLMRESTVLFAGTWWGLLLAVPWAPPRVRAARVALAAVVFVAVLAPWWLRNSHTFEEFVPLSTKGMKNVYLGTLIRPYPVTDYRNQDLVVEPAELARDRDVNRRAAAATTLAERDRIFLAAADDNLRRDPAGQLLHVSRKFLFLWTPNIAPRHADRVGMPLALWGAATSYFLVLGVGLVGLWRYRRDRDAAIVLLAPLVVNTLFHVVVGIAEPRYHFPVLPALLIGTSIVLVPLLRARRV